MKKEYNFSKGVKGKFFNVPDKIENPGNSDECSNNRSCDKQDKFDYTEWRKKLFEGMSVEEICRKGGEFSKKLRGK